MSRSGEGIQAPLCRTFFVSGLLASVCISLQPPGRRRLDEGQNPATLLLGQAGLAPRSFPHAQAVDSIHVEAGQVDAHGSRVTGACGGNLLWRLAPRVVQRAKLRKSGAHATGTNTASERRGKNALIIEEHQQRNSGMARRY